ncbi:MAG: nicotinate (nicotinamide) nucleotide adenylyltransferase [Burkholderiaceae bacterium]
MTQPQTRPPRLGIFGGAFDPPHLAHRVLIEAALAQLQLDKIHVIPTGDAWHKSRALSPAKHRVAMARLAFADVPGVQIDTREVERDGPSYTIDTLQELRGDNPTAELFLIIGQDQAASFSHWRDWRAIVELATICVAARALAPNQAQPFEPPEGLQSRFVTLQLPISDISATDIRERAATGQGFDPLVCAPVARYIVLHRLYQAT